MGGVADLEQQGDNYITESALEAETVGFPEDGYDPYGLGGMTKDALGERLDEIQAELAERLAYRGWRSFGDHQIEQRLAVEGGWIEDALKARVV